MRKAGAIATLLALVLTACSNGGGSSAGASTAASESAAAPESAAPSASAASTPSGESIKLGLVDMISGANAQIGTDTQQGAQIAVDQLNASTGILSRPVELVVKDEAPDSAAAVNAVRTLNSDGIPFVLGFTSSADALAVVPIAKQIDSIIVGSHPASTVLTTTEYVPNFIRISASDAMSTKAIAEFAHEHFPDITKWNVFGYDYITGHDQWDSFVTNLSDLNGAPIEKGKEVFFPFNAVSSLTPYITSMLSSLSGDSAEKEGLYMATFGSGTFNLVKQGLSYDLMNKFKVVMSVAGGGFLSQARELKGDTPDMYSQYDYYYEAYDTPENTAFVNDYKAKYGNVPGTWALHGYMSVLAYKAAIEKAGSTDFAKVLAAFDDLTFTVPQGDITIRSGDHQASVNVVMRHFQPDASSADGFKVSEFEVIKAADILPPVSH